MRTAPTSTQLAKMDRHTTPVMEYAVRSAKTRSPPWPEGDTIMNRWIFAVEIESRTYPSEESGPVSDAAPCAPKL